MLLARRVIGRYETDRAIGQHGPQPLPVPAVLDRRRDLERRPDPAKVIQIERQVMRCRLAGRPALRHDLRCVRRTHVHDVQVRARLLGQPHGRQDGECLRSLWTRHVKVIGRIALRFPGQGGHSHIVIVLCVQQHGTPYRLGCLQDTLELVVVQAPKAVHPGDKVSLESQHVAGKRFHVTRAAGLERLGRDAAIQPIVDDRFPRNGLDLDLQVVPVRHRGHRRARHVDHRRDPAGCRRTAAVIKVLPVRIPGIVKMHVWIDPAGQHQQPAGVEDIRIARKRLANLDDPLAFDADVDTSRALCASQRDLAVLDNHCALLPVSRRPPDRARAAHRVFPRRRAHK